MEQLVTLMAVNLVLLSVITMATLVMLILVLCMLRRTLIRAQKAIDSVETAAMEPISSAKHIFSDLEGFVSAFGNMFRLLSKKRK